MFGFVQKKCDFMFGFVQNPPPTHIQAVWQYAPRYAPRQNTLLLHYQLSYIKSCNSLSDIRG